MAATVAWMGWRAFFSSFMFGNYTAVRTTESTLQCGRRAHFTSSFTRQLCWELVCATTLREIDEVVYDEGYEVPVVLFKLQSVWLTLS